MILDFARASHPARTSISERSLNRVLGCQEAGSDDLLAKMAYLLWSAAAGNFDPHVIRAVSCVRLADLIGVGFPGPGAEAVLSDAVVSRRVDYHTVTQDVYVAAIRWGPAKGYEAVAMNPADKRGKRNLAAAAARAGAQPSPTRPETSTVYAEPGG